MGYAPFVAACDDACVGVYKPPRMHSVPVRPDGGGTLLAWCAARFPDVLKVCGRKPVEGGAVHRLDYETRGLLLFARTEDAALFFRAEQAAGRFVKFYHAQTAAHARVPPAGFPPYPVCGTLPAPDGFCIASGFRAYGRGRAAVRPVLTEGGGTAAVYQTNVLSVRRHGALLHWHVRLTRGFRHQIRCHAAWAGFPLSGDTLYGGSFGTPTGTPDGTLALTAAALAFTHPKTGRPVHIEAAAPAYGAV
jgi:23S rRNA pseudouridine1911/1915/1917 synthase